MIIGVIGGGQLGMMLGQAAKTLSHECIFVDPNPRCSASHVGEVLDYAFDDPAFVDELAARCDVVTYEFENVDIETLRNLNQKVRVYPSIDLLEKSQDRLQEKNMLNNLGIETAKFVSVGSKECLYKAASDLGLPFILKTRRLGYDGKGQYFVRAEGDLKTVAAEKTDFDNVAEGFVSFDAEVSKIAVRAKNGSIFFYPLTQNTHKDGILRLSQVPFTHPSYDLLDQLAVDYVKKILDRFEYVGTLAVEFFVCGKKLIANEIAPRVHNSGHWTLDGGITSQFENHIRAITGMSLGKEPLRVSVAMINVIGKHVDSQRVSDLDGREYDYKKSPRPGRKLAHFNLVDSSEAVVQRGLELATGVSE